MNIYYPRSISALILLKIISRRAKKGAKINDFSKFQSYLALHLKFSMQLFHPQAMPKWVKRGMEKTHASVFFIYKFNI